MQIPISGVQFFEIVKILFHMKISIVNGSLFWLNAFSYYIKLMLNYNPIGRRAQWGALLGVSSSIFRITFVTVFISCFRAVFIQISPSSVFIYHFLVPTLPFVLIPIANLLKCTVRTLALTKVGVMWTAYKSISTCEHDGATVQCFVTDISSSAS